MASSKWRQELEMWGGFLPLWGGFLPPSGAFLPFAAGFSFVLSFFTFFGQMFVFFGGRILPSCNGFSPFQSKISPSLQYSPPPKPNPVPLLSGFTFCIHLCAIFSPALLAGGRI